MWLRGRKVITRATGPAYGRIPGSEVSHGLDHRHDPLPRSRGANPEDAGPRSTHRRFLWGLRTCRYSAGWLLNCPSTDGLEVWARLRALPLLLSVHAGLLAWSAFSNSVTYDE